MTTAFGKTSTLDISQSNSGYKWRTLSLKIHENYSPLTKQNDVAILFMENYKAAIPFIEPIPILLPQLNTLDTDPSIKLTTSGWGETIFDNTKSTSSVLMNVKLDYVGLDACKSYYGNNATLTDSQLCAGVLLGGTLQGGGDSCQGTTLGHILFY